MGAAVSELDATVLITGKVVEVTRETSGGFVRGSALIEEVGTGALLRLEIQNENLAALRDGEVRASVPDIISVLDSATGDVVVTERLRYGRRVSVIAFACDEIWRTEAGLEAAGPTAFGYDFPFVPVPAKGSRAVKEAKR